jgi:hypothetical protein
MRYTAAAPSFASSGDVEARYHKPEWVAMPDNSGAEYYRRRAAEAHRLAELTENKALKEAFLRNAESWRERAVREEHGREQPEGLGDVEDRRAR